MNKFLGVFGGVAANKKVVLNLTAEEFAALKEEVECRLIDWQECLKEEKKSGCKGGSQVSNFRVALFKKVVKVFKETK